MVSICFSSASILRCDLLSTQEAIGLVIPVILQAIITSLLAVLLWNRSRRQLFLACEGCVDLLLSLLQLLLELYPATRRDLHAFRLLDIVIGSMSFIPILFYSLFLCSLILIDLITILPPYIRRVVYPFLIFFVPVLIGMHEAASFIGISYKLSATSQPEIAFQTNREKDLWTFFTSSTLALFAGYQASVSCLAIIRAVQILLQKRRPEHRYGGNPTKLRGIGWVNAGIQLGVVETVIGFAAVACFGTHLARRIIRLFSRVLFCIGLFIDVDRQQQVHALEKPVMISFRQSRLQPFISNPRLSTFHRLSPTSDAFNQKPRAPSMLMATREPGLASTKDRHIRRQRVTIHFDQGAPKLEVRLSHFDLPYPQAVATPTDSPVRSYSPLPDYVPRPFARPYGQNYTDSMASSLSKVEIVTAPRMLFVPELAKATVIRTPSGRTVNRPISSRSQHSDSYEESHESRETKGKRVMSGEQNEEFFEMLMSAGVHSPADYQAGEIEENMDITTVPSGDSLPSVVVSFGDNVVAQEDHRHSAITVLTSHDWLSMTPSQDNVSQVQPTTSPRSVEAPVHQSFLNYDSSRSPTEEYYPMIFRPSQEQLVVQKEPSQSNRLSVPVKGRSGRHLSLPSSGPALGNDIASRASAPPRPPRNPSRTGDFPQGLPDSPRLVSDTLLAGSSQPPQPKSSSNTKALVVDVVIAQRQRATAMREFSPTNSDSDSAYSRETDLRQSWNSQMSTDAEQIAIAL